MAPVMHRIGGEGDAVVLIHGFGADRLGWVANSPALLDTYTVWAAELPAHGTAEPGATTPIDIASALTELLPQNDKPIALIGHSLGGAIAAHLAALRPDQIGKTVLIAPAGFGSGAVAGDFLTGLPGLQSEDEALQHLRQLVVRERLIMPQMAQYVLKHLEKPGRREALAEIAQAALNFELPALPNEALVIWGEEDAINPPDMEWLKSLGERAMLLPQTGHLPHVEAATKVNRRITDYLAS
ncbi:MAG: alpha/beta fold hydrolase [Rhizobiales bacterium]|nr:alpha/beta fold hydrolase [Hyphomicrobiales bacterium]MBO6699963.1 alpha/beta fold hydrolase [Hyphomicrobiales bacterium]MBO6737872.1 alpha/beta fold hydrolase [Hyphomicrobiales bacterium]MBO6913071.1 alpha/beta fold hydrolase [Hyphomicrobiales bacterium]MBO6956659.1 alpha/beta fold hydrolase [Hyphomicrobiales bacterium]